jgi:hypothetical protein
MSMNYKRGSWSFRQSGSWTVKTTKDIPAFEAGEK